MRRDEIDWRGGEVVFWDLDLLDALKPLKEQCDLLKEDLAQVTYGPVILDVGWYPSFAADGGFTVMVVREADWDEPLFKGRADTTDGLLGLLQDAIRIATKSSRPRQPG